MIFSESFIVKEAEAHGHWLDKGNAVIGAEIQSQVSLPLRFVDIGVGDICG